MKHVKEMFPADMINFQAIYTMWSREMKRTVRAKSRIIGALGMPFFFLAFLSFGFGSVQFPGLGTGYINFLAPGIIGMVILFTSIFAGISVIWDRQFGFLKEIMVSPVNRLSIMLGRTIGGVTVSIFQGLLIFGISLLIGFSVTNISGILFTLIYMFLISTIFVSIGTSFASKMQDMQGFQLIMNFFIFPIFLLSGALFPLSALPSWLLAITYINPLTYGVDGIRGSLIGINHFPLLVDAGVLLAFSVAFVALGSYLFGKTEVG